MYAAGEYDLAGFAVGVVDRQKILGPARVKESDVLIAIASSGIHSNGYSLARRVIETEMGLALDQQSDVLGTTVGEALLRPTKIYAKTVAALCASLDEDLHALCHVTGGGIVENLPRVLPKDVVAHIDSARPWPAIFKMIADGGPVELAEMRRTFNLGVGLIAVVSEASASSALETLKASGEDAYLLGRLEPGSGEAHVIYENDPEGHRA
jgi:phosphoribosylformylglycinamidine cyclo-ligase